ncbi:MAG: D-galactonate dehydratase [Candidatus Moanabacter tarae]|uniref:D-galactonate dehydratase n=1 Tax=Candidatus Moanibacter tarae TaxID=2200854 RepID=A0A2Z4AGL7_9BACT|nr:MAG: D-galactonate dehydratase [Candidatus Moanabacter tarae]|tara:strand:+ start:2584 stop:3720 length:1137 start_codon:yes stop_codon:yes gene_type:complete
MKITKFEVTPLIQRGLLLAVHTDKGFIGYGSPMNYEHGRTIERAILDMSEYLIGRDPRQIEDHWQTLFRSSYSRQMPILLGALSGIEMACLDILGKSLDTPIWRLLGGSCRDRIRVYSGLGDSMTPESAAASARKAVEEGFTAIKATPFRKAVRLIENPAGIDIIVAFVSAIREAVGPEVDIGLDFHRGTTPAMAKIVIKELEPLRPLFIEEPTKMIPGCVDALKEVALSTHIPIATGERSTSRWGFYEICHKRAAAILQPDIRACGGILEMKKISNLAEIHEILIAPHSAADPVGIIASIHAMAGTPNFLIHEFGGGTGEGFLKEPLGFEDGFVDLPDGPGLGIEIDEEGLKENTFLGDWGQRVMRRHPEDGTFSDF